MDFDILSRQAGTRALTVLLLSSAVPAQALYITGDLEILRIEDVGSTWVSVDTQNTYTDAVIACTYNLPSDSDNEAVVRLDNVTGTGFDVRIQRPENSASVTASTVYCLISDEGDFTLPSPDGRVYEAHTVLSNGTNGSTRGWGVGGGNGAENVSSAINGSYPQNSDPVVLGQVMSYNDVEFSVFWSFDCDNRRNPPFDQNINDGICVGKHVGQIAGASGNRSNETLGYFVIEEGSSPTGSFGGINYRVDLGGDSVRGVGNSPPYTYSLGATYEFAVATKEAEDGGQGGWAVFYGTDPLASNSMDLAIDEETVAGDTSRSHTTEQVGYWAFRGVDHGDAASSYGDASHIVDGLLSIGPLTAGDADAEAVQYSATASADDSDQLDDEDGLTISSAGGMIIGTTRVTNRGSGTATLCGWLDGGATGNLTADGDFADAGEGQCLTVNATNCTDLTGGEFSCVFTWAVDSSLIGSTFNSVIRVRATTGTLTTANYATAASDGEVEDHPVSVVPTVATIGEVSLQELSLEELIQDAPRAAALLGLFVEQLAGHSSDPDSINITEAVDPDGDGRVAYLHWTTLEERGTIGFQAQRRALSSESLWNEVTPGGVMLPGLIDAPLGGEYLLLDPGARGGEEYEYRLIEIEAWGGERVYGPYRLRLTR